MKTYDYDLGLELEYYKSVVNEIGSQIRAVEKDNLKSVEVLRETNKDMWENASHSSYDLDGAIELSQYYQPLASSNFTIDTGEKKLGLLKDLLSSAYFSRIDFLYDGEEEYEKIYIGRGTLFDTENKNILIYDWRSPIASLFYRFENGRASYEAPSGQINGNIRLKRQYEIKNGEFKYFFDSDVQVADEFLRKMLSGNSSSKMKAIVETIQKDQDIAIRDGSHDLLMVQGVAGSGKTSIALHRVAYLKYKGLSYRLKSSDIIVLSPNSLFETYISNVLPELGEDEVKSVIFDNLILESLLGKIQLEPRYDQVEFFISEEADKISARKEAMEFKMSKAFIQILNRYVEDLAEYHIEFFDIEYDGQIVFTKEELKSCLRDMDKNISLELRLIRLRKYIFEEIHVRRKERMKKLTKLAKEDPNHPFDWEEYARLLSIEESTLLAKKIDRFTKLNSIDLYRNLFMTDGLLKSISEGIDLPENIDNIVSYSKDHLRDLLTQNEDALGMVCLQELIGVNKAYVNIKQLVVDEAQDYYDLHFEVLKLLFPNAKYTILGDVNQTIGKVEDLSLYDRIIDILKPKNPRLMTMNKSFRCTKEILAFSNQFLKDASFFESFNRRGDRPKLIGTTDLALLDEKVEEEIEHCKNQGYKSIGIICKSLGDTKSLYSRLKDKMDIRMVNSDDKLVTNGVFIIPITLSKGLEFDAVLIYGVDKTNYKTGYDRNLLYIGSTRALHRLNLFYVGEKSPLIGSEVVYD